MNNWIPKNKKMYSMIAFATLSMTLYFVGLFFVTTEVKKIENFYASAESETSKEEKFLAIKSITEKNKEPIQTLRDFFIQKGDEVKFIEQIEDIARSSSIKLQINSIDIKAGQKDLFKEDVNVKISIEGSWNGVISFMDKLKKMPFGTSVDSVNLDAKLAGVWSGSVNLTIFREK